MKWAAEHIPSCVTDDIVYSDGGQDYKALGGQIVPSVGANHVHSLVKLVVTSNKVEVFRHLAASLGLVLQQVPTFISNVAQMDFTPTVHPFASNLHCPPDTILKLY